MSNAAPRQKHQLEHARLLSSNALDCNALPPRRARLEYAAFGSWWADPLAGSSIVFYDVTPGLAAWHESISGDGSHQE